MSKTVTIRLPSDLADWIRQRSRKTGIPVSQIVREQLEKARKESGRGKLLRFAGLIDGPADLSSRKGFSRP